MKMLHWPEVERLIGVSRSTAWRWERDGHFPRRVKLGPKTVAWSEEEVLAWLASRPRWGEGGVTSAPKPKAITE